MVISSRPPRFSTATAACLNFLLIIIAAITDTAANTTTHTHSSAINETVTASTFQELETTLQTLRNNGFTLFTNGIATSDIQIQLLSTNSDAVASQQFTLFAPKDVKLFTLDMESSAPSYISTLRYHVIPNRRLTFSDLLNLTSSFLDTLHPHHSVLIGQTQDNGASGVVVDGIRVSEPDLFLGSRFAVHGIDGILVTGLIDHDHDHDHNHFDVNHKDSDWNIPAEGTLDPVSEHERNGVPVDSEPKFDWRIPLSALKKRGKRRGRKVRGHRVHRRQHHGRHDGS